MSNTKSILLLVLINGCTVATDRSVHTEAQAAQTCVDDCLRIQNECHLTPAYPSGGRSCEQACVGLTYRSPVSPGHFCMEDIEIEHFVSCESCLFGDTSDGLCDFSAQFDPTGRCYAVCQPNHEDVEFCGHAP